MYNKENYVPEEVCGLDCMKCGKKLGRSLTFCDECLEKMAECPVDQNTVVNLPQRQAAPVVKKKPKIRRYFWNIEGENDTLRVKIRWLRAALSIAILGFILAIALVIILLYQEGKLDFLLNLLPF